MKSDLYLKTILTIIAFCLSIMVLEKFDFVKSAKASTSDGMGNYVFVPTNEDGSISVRFASDEIDVNITGINTNDELDINIDEIGGGFISHGGPIKVEIDQ